MQRGGLHSGAIPHGQDSRRYVAPDSHCHRRLDAEASTRRYSRCELRESKRFSSPSRHSRIGPNTGNRLAGAGRTVLGQYTALNTIPLRVLMSPWLNTSHNRYPVQSSAVPVKRQQCILLPFAQCMSSFLYEVQHILI